MPTRIAFVLDSFATAAAGTEKQFIALLRGLDRARFEPHVFLLHGEDRVSPLLPGVPVQVLGMHKLLSPGALLAALRFGRRLRSQNFALAHLYFNDTSTLLPWPLRAAGLRVIVSRRDLGMWHTPTMVRAFRVQRPAVSAVVANSVAVRDRVRAAEGFAPERVHVIYNGLQFPPAPADRAAARRSLEIAQPARVLTVVANVKPLKRVGDVIAALPRIAERYPDVVLLVVGADYPGVAGRSHVTELRQQAAGLGVQSHVRFVGAQADPAPYVAAADVCLLCSETEGLSNAVIEYMLAGRPVVASAVGGNEELLAGGDRGALVPAGAVDRIAEAVLTYLDDEKLASAHGDAARRSAMSRFGVGTMVAAHQDLYGQLSGRT